MSNKVFFVKWRYYGTLIENNRIFRGVSWKDVLDYIATSERPLVYLEIEDITDTAIADFEKRGMNSEL